MSEKVNPGSMSEKGFAFTSHLRLVCETEIENLFSMAVSEEQHIAMTSSIRSSQFAVA